MRMVFTRLDPRNPAREFSFTLGVNEDNEFIRALRCVACPVTHAASVWRSVARSLMHGVPACVVLQYASRNQPWEQLRSSVPTCVQMPTCNALQWACARSSSNL